MQALGVTLANDEQVYYFHETDMKNKRLIGGIIGAGLALFGFISMWVFCVTGLLVPLGAWMAYKAMVPSKHAIVGMLLTDRRLIAIPFDAFAPPAEVPLSEITDVDCKRKSRKVTHKRGLAAVAVNVAANALKEHHQNQKGKTHPTYWRDAVELHVMRSGGQMTRWNIEQSQGTSLGPLLATGLFGGWDTLTTVHGVPVARSKSLL